MTAAITIDGREIRREGAAPHERWCLTDLWRAAGEPKLRPAEWLRKDGAAFVDFVRDSVSVAQGHSPESSADFEIVRTTKGNPRTHTPPETWAHWQIALAYAKALSPAFHARVNDVYRAFTAGLLVGRSDDAQELFRLSLRVNALEQGRKSVWSAEMKIELARLRRIDWNGRSTEPQGLAIAYGTTWRAILGDTVYEELKRRNPNPREGTLHAQWLEEQRYKLVKDSDMDRALDCARRCTRWSEFVSDLRATFRREPRQLGLVPQPKRITKKAS